MKSRKICFVSHGLAGGGMERALISLANYYAEIGHEISIVNIYKTEVFFELNPEIKIYWPGFVRSNRLIYILRILLFLRKKITALNPDVVLSFGESFNALTILATRLLNVRVILTNRMWPTLNLGFPISILNRFFYRFADGVIAQTNIAKELITKNSYNQNVVVIPNAVQPITVTPISKKKQLISVGRLSKTKGHSVLVKAFALIPYHDWTLHLIGDGPEYQQLNMLVKQLAISDRVFFHGHLKDFSKLMAESEIFVLPSYNEGFPNALLEAMSVPLACISSDCVAGPADIIVDGVNGLLFEPGNERELAEKISLLIGDLDFRVHLANEAYLVREKLQFDKIAHSYFAFIMNLNDKNEKE